jgi:hypothetical protein
MVDLPIERDVEEDGVDIDDPELLAAIEEGCEQFDRGESSPWAEVRRRIFGEH